MSLWEMCLIFTAAPASSCIILPIWATGSIDHLMQSEGAEAGGKEISAKLVARDINPIDYLMEESARLCPG